MRTFVPMLLVAVLLVAACGKNRVEQLSERAEAYNRSLRWASLQAAGVFMEETKRRSLIDQVSIDLSRNRITEYSIVDLTTDVEKKTGSVLVEFSYYGISDQTLGYRQELQTWKYSPGKNEWFLSDVKAVGGPTP